MNKPILLPDFYVLGAAKCGTTSLAYYLSQVPSIYMPPIKEPHFFDSDEEFHRGVEYYWNSYFGRSAVGKACGDATPEYFHSGHVAAERMRNAYSWNSPPKFILIFREPVARAYSHYNHMKRLGREVREFRAAMMDDIASYGKKHDRSIWNHYYSDGLYSHQLQIWHKYFSPEQFIYLLMEDLNESPYESIGRILEFLNINPACHDIKLEMKNMASKPRCNRLMSFITNPSILKEPVKRVLPKRMRRSVAEGLIRMNLTRDVPEQIDDDIRREITNFYANDLKTLELLINRDLSRWMNEN